MKRIRLLLILFFLVPKAIKSQDKEIDCNFNLREAIFYLEGDKNFKRDTLKSIKFLKPCVNIGDSNSQLVMARLYTAKNDERNYKKAFKLLRKSAKQKNAIAAEDLGVLYKYGHGCNLNFNKARKWFIKEAKLGNNKASYSLGYLYFKGFGNIEQNYTKAEKWFKKSEYPMAKYWLGVCYYYGYGVQQDIQKANDLLGTNFESIITENKPITNIKTPIANRIEQFETTKEISSTIENISENTLFGKWSGILLKYDWSGKHIEHKHFANIEFKIDSIYNTPTYSIAIEDQKLKGNLTTIENDMYFEKAEITLPHRSFKKNIPNRVLYNLLSSNLTLKKIGSTTFLVGNIDSFIPAFNEPGAPLQWVLKKKETFINNNIELSEDVILALATQEKSFIKLYPNPFKSDLIISYTLETPSFVEVNITDINGTKKTTIEKGKEQKTGKHTYFLMETI